MRICFLALVVLAAALAGPRDVQARERFRPLKNLAEAIRSNHQVSAPCPCGDSCSCPTGCPNGCPANAQQRAVITYFPATQQGACAGACANGRCPNVTIPAVKIAK
jgi:hypothetical protein